MFLMHHVRFKGLDGAVVQALTAVYKVGAPAQRHGKIEESFKFLVGETIRSIGVGKLSDE